MKEKIDEIVKKVKDDPDFAKKFKENPVKAVEDILGVDLPDDQINGIIDGVKAKIQIDNAGDLLNKAKGLFNK
jgi:uncharacterized protein YpuA (DUF1002 family)